MSGTPVPKPEPRPRRPPRPVRAVSAEQAQVRRTRADRARNAPATSCPRCHLEPAVDVHEKVRRSQSGGAALDVFVQVPLCRACHDDVTLHPQQAHDEGWVLWSWEYEQQQAQLAAAADTVPAVAAKPEPDDEVVPITLRLPRSLITAMDARAKRHGLSRNVWAEFALQRIAEMPAQVTRGGTRRF